MRISEHQAPTNNWHYKTETAQVNELLSKVLCHNICCMIHAMYELGIDAKFIRPA